MTNICGTASPAVPNPDGSGSSLVDLSSTSKPRVESSSAVARRISASSVSRPGEWASSR